MLFRSWRESSASQEAIAFIDAGGVVLGLYHYDALADDAQLDDAPRAPAGAFEGITLAHNVGSKQAVDKVLAEAVAAGGRLLKPAQDVFWGGYSGYFADPDGHAWEVAWNPFFAMDRTGRIKLPGPRPVLKERKKAGAKPKGKRKTSPRAHKNTE